MSTGIEWTGETWNPTTGCDRVSPGCDNCYAMTLAARLKRMGQAKYQRDGDPRTSGPGFGLTLHPDALDIPLRRKKPTTWFVDSMSDLFHPEVEDLFLAEVLAVMGATPQHTYQVLTKRPQTMAGVLADPDGEMRYKISLVRKRRRIDTPPPAWPLPNVWLGTSIESDRYVWRADHLRRTPAAVRFLSLEPLLGPVPSLDLTGIDWVIVGGESGPNARPMHPEWVRDIRDRCGDAGVPFFFKQWGAWGLREATAPTAVTGRWVYEDGSSSTGVLSEPSRSGRGAAMYPVGKKAAGRELDGRTWDEMPEHAGVVA